MCVHLFLKINIVCIHTWEVLEILGDIEVFYLFQRISHLPSHFITKHH